MFQMVASSVVYKQSAFCLDYTAHGQQINFSAQGGKHVKLSLMSFKQTGNVAMADFMLERLTSLPLLQSLVLRK